MGFRPMFSAALTETINTELCAHLLRADGQEDVCFALYWPSTGRDRSTALIGYVVLPVDGERFVHGNASFTDDYFMRALMTARARGAGVALVHSHPLGAGWQGASVDDTDAECGHAAQAVAVTGHPLVGLTLAGDGSWSARRWNRTGRHVYRRQDADSVRIVGDRLSLAFHPDLRPAPCFDSRVERTVSAWGPDAQADIARLRVGIVGVGSVGSHVAEALARTGVGDIRLIDFDSVEYRNLDRLLHATRLDVALACSKVEVVAEALRQSATSPTFNAEALELSVCEEEGCRAALDCDLIFCCVDRPWPRFVLNVIAYAHLIPVVDGGIYVDAATDPVRMRDADWRVCIVGPGHRCLECSGQYSPGDVDTDKHGYLDDPAYIEALSPAHSARRGENVFAFSAACASLEVLQALMMIVGPGGVSNIGAQHYFVRQGTVDIDRSPCAEGCPFSETVLGLGDADNTHCTGVHQAARDEVQARRARRRRMPVLLGRILDGLTSSIRRWLAARLVRERCFGQKSGRG